MGFVMRAWSLIPAAAALLFFTLPAPAAMTVYIADALARVRPHDAPLPPLAVSIEAARNEYEPFQIIVRAGGNGLKGVSLTATDLRDDHGHVLPKAHLVFYREHYIEITHPSPKSKEGAGWYPDALIPFINPVNGQALKDSHFVGAPFDVEPDANQPVWIDVFVPKDTVPGTYSGDITVTADGQKSVTTLVLITVWDFVLPDTPSMRSNFGGFDENIASAHKIAPQSEEFHALERRYAEALAAHRICPPIPNRLYPKVNDDGGIDPSQTHAALKEWMESFHVTGFPINLLGRDPLGRDRERNAKYLQAMFAYLKTNHWEKLAYIYVLDEPNDAAAYEQVRRRGRLIHEPQPGLKVL